MTISEGLVQAYANADQKGFIYDTIEIDHIGLPQPLYFARGIQDGDEDLRSITLPIGPGLQANFVFVDFGLQRPGHEDGGITRAKLRVDNISKIIQDVMRDVIASDQAFSVTYRCYWSEDINSPEVFTGLRMNQVAITATSAEGELFYDEVDMQAYPREVYDLARFPTLFYN